MTSIVSEFRNIASAVQEGQKHTVALHEELRSQREAQQASQVKHDELFVSLQRQIDELEALSLGASRSSAAASG
eukprot:12044629-Alexandrium_andersonii.AAC.1